MHLQALLPVSTHEPKNFVNKSIKQPQVNPIKSKICDAGLHFYPISMPYRQNKNEKKKRRKKVSIKHQGAKRH
jgi:hypothetical protein